MPFLYTIDPQANLIRESWTGTVDVKQLYASCKAEWADPLYRKHMDMISDFRAAEMEISREELSSFAEYMGRQEALQRHAIVVGRQLGFGLARMFTALSESSSPYWESLRVFFVIEEAEAWIEKRTK